MADLAYSRWHRGLGFSFYAMDLDYIEIRNNVPVAIIEASLCTRAHPTCDDENGVFNRFLSETKGFQFELAYWVAQWLHVPAFVVCMKPLENEQLKGDIQLLRLSNGETIRLDLEGYTQFIENLPTLPQSIGGAPLDLPDLLEKLHPNYPGLDVYPYFSGGDRGKRKWMEDYHLRMQQILNAVPREKPQPVKLQSFTPNYAHVKGETTGGRPKDYEVIRQGIDRPYFNLDWVEWRKEDRSQAIGRPAAMIKTIAVKEPCDLEAVAQSHYDTFISSLESVWWCNVARIMFVNWYLVVYSITQQGLVGERLIARRGDGSKKVFNQKTYAEWAMSL